MLLFNSFVRFVPFALGLFLLPNLALTAKEDSTPTAQTSVGYIEDSVDQVTGAIDLGGQAFGIVSFFIDLMKPTKAAGTKVQIGLNMQRDKDEDQEGTVGIIWAFDVFNHVLGSSDLDPFFIHAGDEEQITIHQEMGEKTQAQYIDVITSDDEVCISWIVTSEASGTREPYTWLGDVGAACGQVWQFGLFTVNGGDRQPYAPRCTWLDADHGEDIDQNPVAITNRQMKINMWAYAGQGNTTMDLDYYCGSTIFSNDMNDPIPGRTPRGPQEIDSQLVLDTGGPNMVRSTEPRSTPAGIRKRSQKSADELVVNSRPYQSAVKLCNSPTSRGSDFVSVDEGLFCDMKTKTLHPLCSVDNRIGCFDLEADKMQLRRRDGVKMRPRSPATKQYKKIHYADD